MTMKLRRGTLTPAYGRDYKSAFAAIVDFEAGKDFFYNSFDGGDGYVSVSDFEPGAEITIRYKRLQQVTPHTVGSAPRAPRKRTRVVAD